MKTQKLTFFKAIIYILIYLIFSFFQLLTHQKSKGVIQSSVPLPFGGWERKKEVKLYWHLEQNSFHGVKMTGALKTTNTEIYNRAMQGKAKKIRTTGKPKKLINKRDRM